MVGNIKQIDDLLLFVNNSTSGRSSLIVNELTSSNHKAKSFISQGKSFISRDEEGENVIKDLKDQLAELKIEN